MAKVRKKSVLPIYAIAAVWLYFGLFQPLYAVTHYITAAVVSAIVFLIARAIWPDHVFETPEPEPEPEASKTTGDSKLDALIDERNKAIGEMRRLNDNIKNARLSAQIETLSVTTSKIIDQVVAHPEKLPQIRKFMNYYLPTTLKILNAYDRMDATGISGENIDGTKQKIEDILDTIVHSFEKQLDSLFGEEAMDISTDITVLENMLNREGLGGMQL